MKQNKTKQNIKGQNQVTYLDFPILDPDFCHPSTPK